MSTRPDTQLRSPFEKTPVRNPETHRGFSLIELLVVMAIIAIMISLIAPAFNSIGGAQELSSGGDLLAGQLDLARQTALAENQRIELRLWNLPDASGSGSAYRAVQLFAVDRTNSISKLLRLPKSVVMTEAAAFSSLLSTANPYPTNGATADVAGLTGRLYKSVRFGPDGSTELNPSGPSAAETAWTVTIVGQNEKMTNAARPAKNFATIQVDPITGRSIVYRP